MSKASEYARLVRLAENGPKPLKEYVDGRGIDVACVTLKGDCSLIDCILNHAQALRLAAWIRENFAEEKEIPNEQVP